jgi:hypothetical protein
MSLTKEKIYEELFVVHRIMQRYLRGNSTQFCSNSEFTNLLDRQVVGSFLFNNSTDYGISIYNDGTVTEFSTSGKRIPYYVLQIYQDLFMIREMKNHEISRNQNQCSLIKQEYVAAVSRPEKTQDFR